MKVKANYLKTVVSVILTLALVVGLCSVAVPVKKVQAAGKYYLKQKDIKVKAGGSKGFWAKCNDNYNDDGTGFAVTSCKVKILSGKDKVKVTPDQEGPRTQYSVYGIKKGVAKVKLTAVYSQVKRNSNYEYKPVKKLATVSTTFKITVTK
jgi:hypothetical protein